MWKVKRMNTARIVVLTIAVGAGGVAAYLASGSDDKPAPAPVVQLKTVDVLVGRQIAAYDIAVKRDLNGVRAALRQSFPNSEIQIEGVGDGVVLSGSAASPIEAQQAGELAARLVGGSDKVVNSIAVRDRDQVMLKVTVAEVARSIVKQLGIDLNASLNYGTAAYASRRATVFEKWRKGEPTAAIDPQISQAKLSDTGK
jgi:Flp pilus assembly secretin CpaC